MSKSCLGACGYVIDSQQIFVEAAASVESCLIDGIDPLDRHFAELKVSPISTRQSTSTPCGLDKDLICGLEEGRVGLKLIRGATLDLAQTCESDARRLPRQQSSSQRFPISDEKLSHAISNLGSDSS